MAPQPKPPGQRRRRNAGQVSWRTLPSEGFAGQAPRLPYRRPAWLKRTRIWWELIWRSPMAAMWQQADVDGLVRLAELKETLARREVGAYVLLPAIQQLEDRYGLNPKARRALAWEIGQAQNVTAVPPTASVRRLRAVDGDAVARS
jgi:hypothetical protein